MAFHVILRRPVVLLCVLGVSLAAAAVLPPLAAQEEGDRTQTDPALRMGPETTARWIEYVQRRIPQLRASGRLDAEIEEWLALSTLEGDSLGPLERAILTAVEMADQSGEPFGHRNLPTLLAKQTCEEVIRLHGRENPAVAYALGRMKFTEGDFQGAHDFFKFATDLELDPQVGGIWLLRAAAAQTFRQIQAGNGHESVADITHALEYCKDLDSIEDVYVILARLSLSHAHRTLNEHAVSERIVNDVIAKYEATAGNANSARMRYELGMVHFEQGAIAEGIRELERVLELISPDHPTYGDAVFTLVDAYTKTAPPRLDEARRLLDEMIEREGELPALMFQRGKIAYERGELEEARAALESSLDFGVPTFDLLIRICSEIGTDEAIRAADSYRRMLEHVQRTDVEGAPKDDLNEESPEPASEDDGE